MPDTTFNTTAGQTIARELLIAYLNVGSSSEPNWSALGARVEESSAEYDWGENTSQDILGVTRSTMKKPIITQSFEPCNLDSGDSAVVKIWNLAVHDQNPQALANQDILVVHFYAGDEASPFAERYPSSMVRPTGLGGEGGGNSEMPLDITYGGERTTGTASRDASTGVVTFTPA